MTGADDERLANLREVYRDFAETRGLPTGNAAFLLRLLDEARAEIARLRVPAGGNLVERAEFLWRELQENNLGGFSGINRPFWIAHYFAAVQHEAVEAAAAFHAAQPGNPAMRAKEADAIRALAEER